MGDCWSVWPSTTWREFFCTFAPQQKPERIWADLCDESGAHRTTNRARSKGRQNIVTSFRNILFIYDDKQFNIYLHLPPHLCNNKAHREQAEIKHNFSGIYLLILLVFAIYAVIKNNSLVWLPPALRWKEYQKSQRETYPTIALYSDCIQGITASATETPNIINGWRLNIHAINMIVLEVSGYMALQYCLNMLCCIFNYYGIGFENKVIFLAICHPLCNVFNST